MDLFPDSELTTYVLSHYAFVKLSHGCLVPLPQYRVLLKEYPKAIRPLQQAPTGVCLLGASFRKAADIWSQKPATGNRNTTSRL